MNSSLEAVYFDGKTTRRYSVVLSLHDGQLVIAGEIERSAPLTDMRISERLGNTKRKLTFPDGACLEVADNAAITALLTRAGRRDSLVVRMQQSWRATLVSGGLIIAVLVLGYLYGLPLAASAIAKALPEKVERSIGSQALAFFDQHLLAPTTLPVAQRDAIRQRFKALAAKQAGAPSYELVFRKSHIGPNAFALPSGQIVLTDEIVRVVDNDDAVMGILAHELGHLHERHLMRRIIQSSTIGAVVTVLFGDVSSVVAAIPTVMLDMKYSRDAEREADDYAINLLKKNGIPLSSLMLAFEKMKKVTGEQSREKSAQDGPSSAVGMTDYLSSHPASDERIARIRAAQ